MNTQDPYISDHFSYAEVIHSTEAARRAVDNSLPDNLIPVVQKTAAMMEKIRIILGNKPISVTSWYRSQTLNHIIGSFPTSQHILGEAVDFICPAFGNPAEIVRAIVANKDIIRYDQVIYEHTWVHVSKKSDPNSIQREQVLSLLESGRYAQGITDKQGVPYEFS